MLILLNGLFTTFLGWAGAGHEYFHSTAFSSNKLNRFLFRVFSSASWNNWGWFETSHQLHHKYTLHTLDPEKPQKNGFTISRLIWMSLVDLPTFTRRMKLLLMNSLGKVPIEDDRIKQILISKPGHLKRIRQGAASVLLYQLVLFIIVTQFSIYLALIVLLSPFTFTLINKIVEINQHFLMRAHSLDFRQNSRTTRFNPIIEFLYSNMNFHAEHHMYPGVPYYNLPKLSSKLQNDGVVEAPSKGIKAATLVAISSGLSSLKTIDCLSCFADCPINPISTSKENS